MRADQEHTEQLSMLGGRVSNEENQLNAETLKLQQVLTYAHVCSRMLTYAHEAVKLRQVLTYADVC